MAMIRRGHIERVFPLLELSSHATALKTQLQAFPDAHIYPNEALYEQLHKGPEQFWQPPIIEELKTKAEGLWNLFLPHSANGAGFTNATP